MFGTDCFQRVTDKTLIGIPVDFNSPAKTIASLESIKERITDFFPVALNVYENIYYIVGDNGTER